MSVAGLDCRLFTETLNGKTTTLDIWEAYGETGEVETLVDHVKCQIWEQEGHRTVVQKLIFEDCVLQNGRTLDYYNVKNGSTLQLILVQLSSDM